MVEVYSENELIRKTCELDDAAVGLRKKMLWSFFLLDDVIEMLNNVRTANDMPINEKNRILQNISGHLKRLAVYSEKLQSVSDAWFDALPYEEQERLAVSFIRENSIEVH